MEYTFAGIATNRVYTESSIDNFSTDFSCPALEFEDDVWFYDSINNLDVDVDKFNFLFLERGTLVFASNPVFFHDMDIAKASEPNYQVCVFVYMPSVGRVMVAYYSGGKLIKEVWESEQGIMQDTDNGLTIPYRDTASLIEILIQEISGKSVWSIYPDDGLVRYCYKNQS